MDENTNGDNRTTPLEAEKPSPTRTEEIGSPLTPFDGVELSTPQEPSYRRSLIDVGGESDDECGNTDAINYDSDGNGPPQATLMDSYHEEHYLIDEIDDDDPEVPETDDIVILSDEDIKKLKVDGLKKELRCRGLSHAGKKAELVERLKKAMVDRVPVLNIHQTSVAPNGFPEKAKWRLLEASEEVEEPECVDPTLVAPSEARYLI